MAGGALSSCFRRVSSAEMRDSYSALSDSSSLRNAAESSAAKLVTGAQSARNAATGAARRDIRVRRVMKPPAVKTDFETYLYLPGLGPAMRRPAFRQRVRAVARSFK